MTSKWRHGHPQELGRDLAETTCEGEASSVIGRWKKAKRQPLHIVILFDSMTDLRCNLRRSGGERRSPQ
ncbi:hypothetical protein D7147_21790 [Micromonospora musae]|uniref:Uncharacterized protein n=1 Tax=Micromonospora musae TaxID=1894970 RepID=A0ABX9R2X5_9ACTN|nr:hypothetical protein D7147_21790 [Micromonospora musae]